MIADLVAKNADWILSMARRYYISETEAGDLAGETIYKCLRNAAKYDEDKDFKPWVKTIMHNTYLSQYSRNRKIIFVPYGNIPLESRETPEKRIMIKQISSAIRKCRRLSRSIDSVLLYVKGYSYREISKIQSIPIGTVRSRIENGRKLLKKELGFID